MQSARRAAVRQLALRSPFNPATWALFANSALLGLGFYMLYPLLAVHFTADLALPAATVGLVLAATSRNFGGTLRELPRAVGRCALERKGERADAGEAFARRFS